MDVSRRSIGPAALFMTGLGSIIGSGWLFGAWKAAKVAGPAAIVAWIIGAIVILLIASSYMELGAMFPQSGGMVRYAQYSHGSLAGFIGGWANWIAIVSVIPVEAQASAQYMASWKWHWAQQMYDGHTLRPTGLAVAGVLVMFYFYINYWTVKAFSRANSFITVFKLAIPAVTVAALIASGFHSSNFHQHGGFAPNGWSAVLTAVATSGIVFAFNGFQSPVNMAGEARNPGRSVPLAVICSVLVAAVVYIGLQIAFIGAVPGRDLLDGWGGVNFESPFADLALAVNLNWLAVILYGDAFVSPSGTGMTYTATTARMIQGMSDNGHLPRALGQLHPRYGVPRPAMWLNLVVSFAFLCVFRGWGTLSAVIGVATVISYVTGPVCVVVLRRTAADLARPLKLKGLPLLAPATFVLASEVLYWSRWPLTGQVILIMVIGLPVYLYYQFKGGFADFARHVRSGIWLPAYLLWLALLSATGSSKFGGHGLVPYGWDMALVAVSSLAFYYWGVRSGGLTEPTFPELTATVAEKDLSPL
ncbi:APC family permease [Streptomyces sp. NPDC051639]|uniref:APC family permease n=1 Tax=Streptomyces sp. NPDC051639 TaxID=3155671 RepID=UPI00344335CD